MMDSLLAAAVICTSFLGATVALAIARATGC